MQVANLAIAVDPERIAVGGGLMSRPDAVLDALERRLRAAAPFPPELVPAAFVHDGPLRGAIALALDEVAAMSGERDARRDGRAARGAAPPRRALRRARRDRARASCREPLAGVVFVARGSSDNAAVYGRYLAELASGRPAGLAAPSLHTLYNARAHYAGFLVVAISQSGATPEIVTVCRRLRSAGARTVAIVNDADSPLAGAVDGVLRSSAGPELAVPATKTVTGQMLAVAAVAAAHRLGAVHGRRARRDAGRGRVGARRPGPGERARRPLGGRRAAVRRQPAASSTRRRWRRR